MNKKSFEVALGNKYDWGNKRNYSNNLNKTAVNYHANNINKLMMKSGTSKFTRSDAVQSLIYSFINSCYLIKAGISTASIRYQYNLMWGKHTGKFAYSKVNVILCRIFKGGKSLNGWYYFW